MRISSNAKPALICAAEDWLEPESADGSITEAS